MNEIRTYSMLALTGAAPFVACAVLPLVGWPSLEPFGRLDAVASSYGLAISSFVAGSHWGIFLRDSELAPVNLFITSNVALLMAWITYIAAPLHWQLAVQILVFTLLWAVDSSLVKANVITAHYFRLRSVATVIVCTSLAITMLTG